MITFQTEREARMFNAGHEAGCQLVRESIDMKTDILKAECLKAAQKMKSGLYSQEDYERLEELALK